MRMIPEGAEVYLWTIPELEKEISHECRAYELAYYLFPSGVHYNNEINIVFSDYVICEKAFVSQLKNKLFLFGLLFGNSTRFEEAYRDEDIAIFAREGRKLLDTGGKESEEVFYRRVKICEAGFR
jgi:hypothetical protein